MLLFFVLPAVIAAVALVCVGRTAFALQTVPYRMNFQGRLTDAVGVAKPDGVYNLKFRIYNAASTVVWSEDRLVSATQGVQVTGGLFTVQLGTVTPLDPALFNNATANQGTMTLEVELPTPATATSVSPSWTEGAMTPRNPLATSAYAFNSDTVDGLDSSVLARLDTTNTFTSAATFNGTSLFSVNDPSAVGIQNTSGTRAFTADTSNMIVQVGSAAANSTSVVFVLDTKNTAGDPAGAQMLAGSMYYNSDSGKFRCYQGGWVDCITSLPAASTLQSVYTASTGGTTPEIKVDATRGGLAIQDANSTIAATLFGVHASNAGGLGAALFTVSSTGVIVAQPTADTTNTFAIKNTGGTDIFTIDSQNVRVYVGNSAGTASAALLVLASNTADGASVPGAMYYNTVLGRFRCYQGGWVDCTLGEGLVKLAADQSATQSSTAFQNVTGLAFTMAASETYSFDIIMPVNMVNTTADLKYTLVVPAGATVTAQGQGPTTATAATNCAIQTSAQSCALSITAAYRSVVSIRGVVTNGGTPGDMQVQFAQSSATAASSPTVLKGTTLRYDKL